MEILSATEENIRKAASFMRAGGLVIYPTETVYGLGCAPMRPDAAERLCFAKGRADKPLPLICASNEDARYVVEFNMAAERLIKTFWPGPLTIVLPSKIEYSIWVTHGAKTLGVRVPDHEVSKRLAELAGGVIVSTSANKSGEPPAQTASEAAEIFGKKVDIILDGGRSTGGVSSTVIDLSGEFAWILRKGPITGEQLKRFLSG